MIEEEGKIGQITSFIDGQDVFRVALRSANYERTKFLRDTPEDKALKSQQVEFLCDMVSPNPFPERPLIDSLLLTPDVIDLAQHAYDQVSEPDHQLDPTPLKILADALEEAGCSNEEILASLRSGGPHFKGYWVIDQILGKE